MLEFKQVTVDDRKWVCDILSEYPCHSLEYNFTTIFIWSKIYNTKIAEDNGFLFVMSGKKEPSFLFPAGRGDVKKALRLLEEYSKTVGIQMSFYSLSEKQKDILNEVFPGYFEFEEIRDAGDYVYTEESLRTLKGKKLSSKRNHINRFVENNPDWKYVSLTRENMYMAENMHNEWCDMVECDKDSSLSEEGCALRMAFEYFEELGLSGGMIIADERPVAFSIGDKLNDETFLVHIEKAYADIQGAYPMINQQFVIKNCQGYKFINREDDAGDEGLRKAKLSYRPCEILVKYNTKIKENVCAL